LMEDVAGNAEFDDLRALRVLCFVLFMGRVEDSVLVDHLIPVLTDEDFSVEWLLEIDIRDLRRDLGSPMGDSAEHPQMLKTLAKALLDRHDGLVPRNYPALTELPHIDIRSASLFLEWFSSNSDVSVC